MAELATLIAAVATLVAAVTNVVITYGTRKDVHEVHLSTNSRLDELLMAAHAAGVREGRDEQ